MTGRELGKFDSEFENGMLGGGKTFLPGMKTSMARHALLRLMENAEPDAYVTSVADLSKKAAGLSTGATAKVLREAVDAGWLRSTRGPEGGYWRTDLALPPGPDYGSDEQLLMESLEQAQTQMESMQATVAQALGHAAAIVQDGPALVSSTPLRWPVRDEAYDLRPTPEGESYINAQIRQSRVTSRDLDQDPPGLVDIDIPRQTCAVSAIAEFADRTTEPPVRFDSERAFLTADPSRSNPHFVLHALYDGPNDTAEWVLKHCPHTHEVYAYRTTPPIPSEAQIILDDAGHNRMHPDYAGDPDGPCWRLGTIYNDRLLHELVDNTSLMRRPGGVVWVYGRLRALNTAIHELVMSDGTLAELGENLADYDEARR